MTSRIHLALLALALGASSANAGTVHGTLRVPPGSQTVAPVLQAYAGQAASLPDPTPIVHGLVTDAVIWSVGLPAAAESALAEQKARLQMAQKGQNFVPRVVPVSVGRSVDFPNFDPIFHNAFSVSPVKRFDLGKYPRGQSRKVVFSKTGVVQVFCDIHANMAGYVRVVPSRAVIMPDGFGEFAFAGDLWAEGMLWGQTLRSPHASARILGIDIGPALAIPGVAVEDDERH